MQSFYYRCGLVETLVSGKQFRLNCECKINYWHSSYQLSPGWKQYYLYLVLIFGLGMTSHREVQLFHPIRMTFWTPDVIMNILAWRNRAKTEQSKDQKRPDKWLEISGCSTRVVDLGKMLCVISRERTTATRNVCIGVGIGDVGLRIRPNLGHSRMEMDIRKSGDI